MDSKRMVVNTKDVNGNKLQLAIVRPTNKINQDANMAYHLKMSFLIRNGSKNNANRLMLRSELEKHLADMGVWTLKDSVEIEKLALEIRAHELLLKKGGIKVSEGRTLALQMAEKRQIILEKHYKRLQFDSATIESQAENFRFEFLLVKCLVSDDTGLPFLKGHDEYVVRQDEVSVMDGAKVLANMLYGLEDNIDKNMFEMKWLQDAGMINSDGRYTKPDGTIVDRNGRLINEEGRYVNKDGKLIDTFGRSVDGHGNLLIDDSEPFVDDETGEEITIGDIGLKKKKKGTKRKRKSTKKKDN